jgi:hypothetical protein
MNKHHGRHNDSTHYAHILMYGSRGHHAMGGPAMGNMTTNMSQYKKGGATHRRRHRHAEGDMAGVSPITGQKSPDMQAPNTPMERRRGGRACHAEGDTVATPYRHGGKPHHMRRGRHAEGEMAEKRKGGRACHGWGDFVEGAHNVVDNMGKGMRYLVTKHASGDSVEAMHRGGRKKKS